MMNFNITSNASAPKVEAPTFEQSISVYLSTQSHTTDHEAVVKFIQEYMEDLKFITATTQPKTSAERERAFCKRMAHMNQSIIYAAIDAVYYASRKA